MSTLLDLEYLNHRHLVPLPNPPYPTVLRDSRIQPCHKPHQHSLPDPTEPGKQGKQGKLTL